MAESNILLRIGSVFSGEGLKKMREGIASAGTDMKKSIGATTALVSAIGSMNSSASKAANAINGMIGAIVSGNPAIIAMTTAMTAINLAIDKMKGDLDALEKKAAQSAQEVQGQLKKLQKEMMQGYEANFKEHMKSIESISESFKSATEQANQFVASMTKLEASQANEKIVQMEIEKVRAISEQKQNLFTYLQQVTDNEVRQAAGAIGNAKISLASAIEDQKIAYEKATQREQDSSKKVDEAYSNLIDEENKRNNIQSQLSELEQAKIEIESEYNRIGKKNVEMRSQLQKQLEDIEKKMEKLSKEDEDQEQKIKIAKIDVETAEQEHKNMIANMTLTREKADQEVNDAKNAVMEAEREQAEKVKEATKKREEEERKRLEQERDKTKQELNKATNDKKKTSADLQDAIDKYNSDYNRNSVWDRLNNWNRNGGFNQIGQATRIGYDEDMKRAGQIAVEQAQKEGRAITYHEAERIRKEAERKYRDYANSKEAKQVAADERRLAQLEKEEQDAARRGKELDPRKAEELSKLRGQKATRGRASREIEKAQQADQQMGMNVQKCADKLTAIEQKLGIR